MRLVGGEFHDNLNHVVEKVRKTLSVRVAAAEVYRAKESAVAEPTFVLASGAVLLLINDGVETEGAVRYFFLGGGATLQARRLQNREQERFWRAEEVVITFHWMQIGLAL